MSLLNDGAANAAQNKFLSLDYTNLPLLRKIYLFMRSRNWYEKISTSCNPSSNDRDMITSFLENGFISDNDVIIFKIRGKHYFLIRNDSVLNAMRICS